MESMKFILISLLLVSANALAATEYTCSDIDNGTDSVRVNLSITDLKTVVFNSVERGTQSPDDARSFAQFFPGFVDVEGKLQSPIPGGAPIDLLVSQSLLDGAAKGSIKLVSKFSDGDHGVVTFECVQIN